MVWILYDQSPTPLLHSKYESDFGSTKNSEARKDFEKGLLLLHNFEYPDAQELFREAQKKDPLFGLAYWGEAMTYNHPVWQSQDAVSARTVLQQYKNVKQGNNTEVSALDKDFLKSMDVLYGEGKKTLRDKAYADFMATLYDKYKGNQEVAAFYALSLLGSVQGWDKGIGNKAAAISAVILKENPKHPGALHYFIHAQDHPDYAKFAWNAANDYARVASYSGHALHMPSHIFLALGLWDNVVSSNEVSWQAGVDRKKVKNLNNDALNYHGHWWLGYGYLQQGRFAKAQEVLKHQLAFTRELPSASARSHFLMMKGHYLIETNDWENSLALEEVEVNDLKIEIRTLDQFLKGLLAYRNNDEKLLEKIVQQIQTEIDQSKQMKLANEDGIPICKVVPFSQGNLPSQSGINQAIVLKEELSALLAYRNKDLTGARIHFQNAIELEEKNGYSYGPPEILKPTLEFYGEFLLSIHEPQDALVSFEKALQKSPGRTQSLLGLIEACRKTGADTKAAEATRIFKANLRNADSSDRNRFFTIR